MCYHVYNFTRMEYEVTCFLLQALLQAQTELRQIVPGFTFNLGFAGGYYGRGLNEEVVF